MQAKILSMKTLLTKLHREIVFVAVALNIYISPWLCSFCSCCVCVAPDVVLGGTCYIQADTNRVSFCITDVMCMTK